LEHGGIGLQYNCPKGCPDLIDQLRQSVPQGFTQFVLSPYPSMDRPIAITAWHRLLYLDSFDASKIKAFIDAYKNKGPEDNIVFASFLLILDRAADSTNVFFICLPPSC